MAIEHSVLTGASLHEPKGVSTALSGTVYISNGLGSGVWTDFDEFNAFGGSLLHVRDQRSSGSAAQTLTNATWVKRDLQTTLTNEIASATLTSSVISLPAGTYFVVATADTFLSWSVLDSSLTGTAKIKLRNTSDSVDLVVGHGWSATHGATGGTSTINTVAAVSVPQKIVGRFTLAGTKNIELQSWATLSSGTRTGGVPITTGSVEVYSDVLIWKID